MKFTVERSRWLRGEGSSRSYLRRHLDGKQCCMGFYAEALGHGEGITGVTSLGDARIKCPLTFGERYDSTEALHLYDVNDRTDIGDAARERIITEVLAALGIDVDFVD